MNDSRPRKPVSSTEPMEQRLLWKPYANSLRRKSRLPLVVTIGLSLFAVLGWFQERPAPFAGIKSLEARDSQTRRVEELQREVNREFRLQRPDLFLVFSVNREIEPQDVRAVRQAVERLRRLPQVEQTLWIDDVPAVNLLQLTRSILPADTISRDGFREEMSKVASHPLAHGQLMSLDGREFLVPVQLDWLEVTSDEAARDELLETSRKSMALVEDHQVTVEATGDVPLYLDQLAAHRRNQSRFQWIGYSLVLVVASIMYRSPLPVMLVGLAPAAGIFWSTAILRWLGEPSNPLSDSVLPVLVAIVGVTDGVHLLAMYRDGLASGLSAREATARAIEEVAQACFLTSLTTAIGFLSLLFADSELVRGFGRACAIGVSLAFLAMLTVFPLFAAIEAVGRRVPGMRLTDHDGFQLDRWILPLLRFPRITAVSGSLLTLLLGVCLFQLKADDRRAYGLPSTSPAFQTLQRVDEAFGGIDSAQVVIEWEPRLDQTPELLEVMREIDRAIQDQRQLGRSLSLAKIADTIPLAPGSSSFDFVSLIPSFLRDSLYAPQARRSVVSFRVKDIGVAGLAPVFRKLEERFVSIEQHHAGVSLALTGDGVVRGRRVVRVIEDLKWSLAGAGAIIFGLLAIVLRSWKLGWLSIIPNIAPISISAGILLLLGRQLDISAACALTICLGIAVDDTVHYLTRYQRERMNGHSSREANRLTLQKVGLSLVATTAIMSIGFSTVLLSEMPSQRIFGAMSVATIVAALIADLLLLPSLLLWLDQGTNDVAED